MPFVRITHAFAAVAVLSAPLQGFAQQTQSHANTYATCDDASPVTSGATSASCKGIAAGGLYYSDASSDNAARSVSASTSGSKVARNVLGGSNASADAHLISSFFVAGTAPLGSEVVFHFLTSGRERINATQLEHDVS